MATEVTEPYRFSVIAVTRPGEQIFVTGSCVELGKWRLSGAIGLTKTYTASDESLWTVIIPLPLGQDIYYRYFVGTHGGQKGNQALFVKTFEGHLQPRQLNQPTTNNICVHDATFEPAHYGVLRSKTSILRGWLTSECEVHLRFSTYAIHWWKARHRTRAQSIKIVPVDLRWLENSQEDDDDLLSPNADDMEISVLNKVECNFSLQKKFGRILKPEEVAIFRIRVVEPQFMAYRCEFFAYESGTEHDGSDPCKVGYCYILPSKSGDIYGERTVIINGLKHQPIGQLLVHDMLIQPCREIDSTFEVSYAKYWRTRKSAVNFAHRGMGNSFSDSIRCANAKIRENTMASMAAAVIHGADFVEFDVHLSKDKIPIIYHDFTCYITTHKGLNLPVDNNITKEAVATDLYEIPVRDLTLQQLQMLKLNHVSERDGNTKYNAADDHQPFPTLEKALQELDPYVGFNVEIKFPLPFEDGTHEAEHFSERNEHVDAILGAVWKSAGRRRILFTCFDPDVCLMIRAKQSKYPVICLSYGELNLWPAYADNRTQTIRNIFYTAVAYDLLGISVHTENVLSNKWLMPEAKEAGMVIIVWGEDVDDPSVIRQMNDLGVAGIYYDRIEEFTMDKENVFRLENRAQRALLDHIGEIIF